MTNHINVKYDNDLSAVIFSTQEVYTLLNKLDVHKAYGTDNLSPHIITTYITTLCTTQLLDMYHAIGSVLDASGQADIIYLDFSKAFDSVNHKLLLHKLQSFGIIGNLLSWFNS